MQTHVHDKRLLVNRVYNSADYDVKDNWYAIQEILSQFKSVHHVELFDTCSSSGDWQGFFIQYLNHKYYMISFYQENNWPRKGFTGYTGRVLLESNDPIPAEIAYDVINFELVY